MSVPPRGNAVSLSTIRATFDPSDVGAVAMSAYYRDAPTALVTSADPRASRVPTTGPLSIGSFYPPQDPAWSDVVFLATFDADVGNRCPMTGDVPFVVNRVDVANGSVLSISSAVPKFGDNLLTSTSRTSQFSPVIKYAVPRVARLPVLASTGRQALGNTFTVEFWAAQDNRLAPVLNNLPMRVVGARDRVTDPAWAVDEWLLELNATGGMRLNTITNWMPEVDGSGTLNDVTPASKTGDVWCHYALCRVDGTLYWCANGVVVVDDVSLTDPGVYGAFVGFRFDRLRIGSGEYTERDGFYGRLDDVRITVGTARYVGPTTYEVPVRAADS